MDVNREKALDLAVSQIEKQFGKGAIMKLGEGGVAKDVPVISTGSREVAPQPPVVARASKPRDGGRQRCS